MQTNLFASARSWVIVITILMSGVLTIIGLMQQQWPNVLPIRSWGAVYFFIFVVGTTLLFAMIARITKWRMLSIAMMCGLLIALYRGEVLALLAVIFYGLSALALGHLILRWLSIPDDTIGDTDKLLLGAGVFASIVGISAHFPINFSSVYVLVLVLPIFYEQQWLSKHIKNKILQLSVSSHTTLIKEWPVILLSVMCFLHFCFAFLPELGHDALATHLFVPAQVATHHEWSFNPQLYVWVFMPMLGDWNYTIGYVLGGEVAARLINVGFIFILVYLIRDVVLWLTKDHKSAIWAMLLFVVTPLTFTESSSLFIESVWSSYIVAATFWILKIFFEPSQRTSGILLVSIMLAFAAAAKAVTLIYLPALLWPILWLTPVLFSKPLRAFTMKAVSCFLLFGGIPYVISYLVTGNPVFPFFNAYFKSPLFAMSNFDNKLFSTPASWDLPYDIVFASSKYMEATVGASGFQWIMLLLTAITLLLLFKNKRAIVLVVMGTLAIVLLFHFQSYLRYAFPVVIFLSMLIGVSVALSNQLSVIIHKLWLAMLSITIALNLVFFGAGVWPYRDIPIFDIFSQGNIEEWMLARSPIRLAVSRVNALNNEQTPVVFLSPSLGGTLVADALYDSWYNPTFNSAMRQVREPQDFAQLLNKYNAKYVILSSTWRNEEQRKVVENATNLVADFGLIKLRVLKD